VNQLDLKENFIKTWNTVEEASEAVGIFVKIMMEIFGYWN